MRISQPVKYAHKWYLCQLCMGKPNIGMMHMVSSIFRPWKYAGTIWDPGNDHYAYFIEPDEGEIWEKVTTSHNIVEAMSHIRKTKGYQRHHGYSD